MINASQAFKDALLNDERAYLEEAVITLYDGTVLNISNEQIWGNSFSVEDAVSSDNVFQVGAAIVNSATLTINNIYDTYTNYDFYNARVVISVGLNVERDGVVAPEMLRKGTFIVYDAVYDFDLIKLSLIDNMSKFDHEYSLSNLGYPATLGEIVSNACSICDVTLNTYTFPHHDYQIQTRPDDEALTFRDVISNVAQIAGCFARCDNYGRLELKWYDQASLEEAYGFLDGGTFTTDEGVRAILSDYLDTTEGMTLVTSGRLDDVTTTVNGVNWFTFEGRTANNIYVNSNSWIVLGGSQPSSPRYTYVGNINICRRDGQMVRLYRQEGTARNLNFLKIRFEGYTHYTTSAQTRTYQLDYELFLLSTGQMFINLMTLPTNSSYMGSSAIVDSNVTTSLAMTEGYFLATAGSEHVWVVSQQSDEGYVIADIADGGSFRPWNLGYVFNVPGFDSLFIIHNLYSNYSLSISTDDVVITGIRTTAKSDEEDDDAMKTYTTGQSGYVIGIENNVFVTTDNAQEITNWLGRQLIGVRFRKASITHSSDPTIEAGDVGILWDLKSRAYPFLFTRTKFAVGSAQTSICGAETPAKNSAVKFTENTKNYVELRRKLVDEKTDREQALEDLAERLAEKNAMYTTVEQDEHGQDIAWYLHDQPTLRESAYVWKMTTSAWGVSTDGGRTWNAGMTVDGDAITRILTAIGVRADWIKSGTLTLGGSNNVNGLLEILNSSGTRVGRWDNTALYVGNIATSLNNPNTKINTNGAITTKSLTASGYVYVDGDQNSYIRIPTDSDRGTTEIGRYGLKSTLSTTTLYVGNRAGETSVGFSASNSSTSGKSVVDPDLIYISTRSQRTLIYPDSIRLDRYTNGEWRTFVALESSTRSWIDRDFYVSGSLTVSGTKNRSVSTEDYGARNLYAYETPSPLFGDVGEGEIASDGKCYVQIDSIFAETVSLDQYQVFLQKYGNGDCWVSERKGTYFLVEGTAGMAFGWEIKAKQRDFDQRRLDRTDVLEVNRE